MTETLLWQRYRRGKRYQAAMGFPSLFPQCVDFREGRQWPPATRATRNLPRPVFNFCEKTVATKRANILNQPVRLLFSPAAGEGEDAALGAAAYTDFAAALWHDLRQDALNEEFLTDAATVGTGILHYYWDGAAANGKGALCGEVLDPLTVLFANPCEKEVQRQEYILIASRLSVTEVRRMAAAEGLSPAAIAEIVPEEETPDSYEATRKAGEEEKQCTLLTQYRRCGTRVVFDRATKNVLLVRGRSLTPGFPDEGQEEGILPFPRAVCTRYPLALLAWKPRKRSLYGIGEVEGMLPTQKAINWLMGMNILSVQDTAWPKLLVKPGALRQEVTNTPGEILEDHTGTGTGVRYLEAPGISASATALAEHLKTLLQETSGSAEVITGDTYTGSLAASAIIALQNQAKQPIVSVQKRFYRVLEEVGRIWEEFFRCHYTLPRAAATKDGGTMQFAGADFAAAQFSLTVEAGAGSEYSEALAQATLDRLYERGDIDLSIYAALCPETVMPFKHRLRQCLREREESAALEELLQNREEN